MSHGLEVRLGALCISKVFLSSSDTMLFKNKLVSSIDVAGILLFSLVALKAMLFKTRLQNLS
jgi:hypothetical protein